MFHSNRPSFTESLKLVYAHTTRLYLYDRWQMRSSSIIHMGSCPCCLVHLLFLINVECTYRTLPAPQLWPTVAVWTLWIQSFEQEPSHSFAFLAKKAKKQSHSKVTQYDRRPHVSSMVAECAVLSKAMPMYLGSRQEKHQTHCFFPLTDTKV